jgi:hypothetical protein
VQVAQDNEATGHQILGTARCILPFAKGAQ